MQQTLGNRATRQLIQRTARVSSLPEPAEDIGARIQSRSGGGSALDAGVQRQLESAWARTCRACAYMPTPRPITWRAPLTRWLSPPAQHLPHRMYNPGTSEGMHLLAHEATHAVQQAAGPVAGTPTSGGVAISDPGDSYEQAANAAAGRVASGQATPTAQTMRPDAYAAVQREGEEEEPVQAMRTSAYTAVQRQGPEEGRYRPCALAPTPPCSARGEEEEPVQAMRTSTYTAVQRQGEEEEPCRRCARALTCGGAAPGAGRGRAGTGHAHDLAVQREGERKRCGNTCK